ncbi:metal ABC transporter solute-binding protein, Zn/Mn family [Acinetobacter rathckeae]|uniref:metal ABC transporter solute-binding protein, Zn/Mn family n=1 Tax=Acinetobacter rathckeae TaxID=2605272 RepID=UPI0018A2AA0D|nr:zinc ABC transporter substrate-binding protein [Acinetobacter rathckeae]MBF7688776.1 zinc ABC transporter substrate-binding protein [Acinetobacter rathckeae]MBF7696253.1 zinc ABC transporter substrate-binding protein [Acinetobacter rathckeae]
MARLIAVLALVFYSHSLWAKGLVVSIHPLYLIAQEVTKGVEEPELLLGNQSGHDIQLTPENRKSLQDAEMIIWLGKAHEAPLNKLLADNPKAFSLLSSGVLNTLPLRDVKGNAIAQSVDTHVWLEPNNAVRIAFFIAAARSKQHPEHKAQYWANARAFSQKFLLATRQFGQHKTPIKYWSYHDAYQYIERASNIKLAGALTSDPHVPPTVSQMKYLNDNRPYANMCLLAEGEASRSQYQKLQPIYFQPVNESLMGENDFIKAWTDLAQKIHQCVQTSVKS